MRFQKIDERNQRTIISYNSEQSNLLIEPLEPRLLFNFDPVFHSVGLQSSVSSTEVIVPIENGQAQWVDGDGDSVTLTLKGGGAGEVVLPDQTGDALAINLTGTTANTSLSFNVRRSKAGGFGNTIVSHIETDGLIKNITGKNVIFSGGTIDLNLQNKSLGNKETVSIDFFQVEDAIIDTNGIPIKNLKLIEWYGENWYGDDYYDDAIRAPWIDSINVIGGKFKYEDDEEPWVFGEFSANIELSGCDTNGIALGKMTVKDWAYCFEISAPNGGIGNITVGTSDCITVSAKFIKSFSTKCNNRYDCDAGSMYETTFNLSSSDPKTGLAIGKLSVFGYADFVIDAPNGGIGSLDSGDFDYMEVSAQYIQKISSERKSYIDYENTEGSIWEGYLNLSGSDSRNGLAVGKISLYGTAESCEIYAPKGGIGNIVVGEWYDGTINTQYISSFTTKFSTRYYYWDDGYASGDFYGEINLSSSNPKTGLALGRLKVGALVYDMVINAPNAGLGKLSAAKWGEDYDDSSIEINTKYIQSFDAKGIKGFGGLIGNVDLNLTSMDSKGFSLNNISAPLGIYDSSISAAGAVGTIKASNWVNDEDSNCEFTAQSVKSITIKGKSKFGQMFGNFSVNTNITGKGAKGFSIGKLSVAGVAFSSTIRSAGSVGNVTFGGSFGVDLLAGVSQDAERFAVTNDAFENPKAHIKSIKIKGTNFGLARHFANSNFSAASIGTVNILDADFNTGLSGIYTSSNNGTNAIKRVTYKDRESGDKWTWPKKGIQISALNDFIRIL